MNIDKTSRRVGFHKLPVPKSPKLATKIPLGGSMIGGPVIKKPRVVKGPAYGAFPRGHVY